MNNYNEKYSGDEKLVAQYDRLKKTNKMLWAAAIIFLIFVLWLAFLRSPNEHVTPKPMHEKNRDTTKIRTPEPEINPEPPAQ